VDPIDRANELLQRYALMYPVAKPAALLVRGWIASREANAAAAEKLYRRAIELQLETGRGCWQEMPTHSGGSLAPSTCASKKR